VWLLLSEEVVNIAEGFERPVEGSDAVAPDVGLEFRECCIWSAAGFVDGQLSHPGFSFDRCIAVASATKTGLQSEDKREARSFPGQSEFHKS
jgi:hypothetical protein